MMRNDARTPMILTLVLTLGVSLFWSPAVALAGSHPANTEAGAVDSPADFGTWVVKVLQRAWDALTGAGAPEASTTVGNKAPSPSNESVIYVDPQGVKGKGKKL